MERLRVDKWLWAARFYKTRSIAKAAIEGGKVHLDGQRVKVSRDITIGEQNRLCLVVLVRDAPTVVYVQFQTVRGGAGVEVGEGARGGGGALRVPDRRGRIGRGLGRRGGEGDVQEVQGVPQGVQDEEVVEPGGLTSYEQCR